MSLFYQLQPGMVLADRYELKSVLGRGAFGTVFKAFDRVADADVALKFLNPEKASDPNLIRRFRNEIWINRKIRHDHVCLIFDLNEIGDLKFISMEFIDGQTLDERVTSGPPLSFEEKIRICLEICSALSAAHRNGVVHRDLKLENVMLDAQGRTKLMDFGISRMQDTTRMTSTDQIIGTTLYMAPEQWKGEETSAATDIYALGVMMYLMFAGQPPFQAPTPVALFYGHLHTPPPDPRDLNSELPGELADAMLICLAKSPADRYQSTDELAEELRPFAAQVRAPQGTGRRSAKPPVQLEQQSTEQLNRRASTAQMKRAQVQEEPEEVAVLAATAGIPVVPVLLLGLLFVSLSAGGTYLLLRPPTKPTPAPVATPTETAVPPPRVNQPSELETARTSAAQLFDQQVYIAADKSLDALRAYRRILALQSGDPDATSKIARIAQHYREQGDAAARRKDFAAAKASYQLALQAAPDDATLMGLRDQIIKDEASAGSQEQQLQLAQEKLRAFEAIEARVILDGVLQAAPAHAEAQALKKEADALTEAGRRLDQAALDLASGRLDSVEAIVRDLEGRYPGWQRPKQMRAELAQRLEARKLVEQANASIKAKRFDEADGLLVKAAELAPLDPELTRSRTALQTERQRAEDMAASVAQSMATATAQAVAASSAQAAAAETARAVRAQPTKTPAVIAARATQPPPPPRPTATLPPPRATATPEPAAPAVAAEGTLKLQVKPWAQIQVDGQDRGTAQPGLKVSLSPGKHKVLILNPDLKARLEREVEIKAGETATLSENVLVGELQIEPDPPGIVTVVLPDGSSQNLGMSPVLARNLPGGKEVKLLIEVGGKPYRFQVEIRGGGKGKFDRKLQ